MQGRSGYLRSGHQVRSSNLVTQQFYNRATTTMLEGKLSNFRNMIRTSVPTKRISRFLCICDLRSGHFCDLPIISQWQQINSLFSASAGVYLNGIASCRTFIDTLSNFFFDNTFKGHLRSSEVTNFFSANDFGSKRDRDMKLVSLRSSRQAASTDVQFYIVGSLCEL